MFLVSFGGTTGCSESLKVHGHGTIITYNKGSKCEAFRQSPQRLCWTIAHVDRQQISLINCACYCSCNRLACSTWWCVICMWIGEHSHVGFQWGQTLGSLAWWLPRTLWRSLNWDDELIVNLRRNWLCMTRVMGWQIWILPLTNIMSLAINILNARRMLW